MSSSKADKESIVVVIESGDFTIKNNTIEEVSEEGFFVEKNGKNIILNMVDMDKNVLVSYNNCYRNTFIQRGSNNMQIGNRNGCSIQQSNGVEIRNFSGKKLEINTTKNIPIYINGHLIEGYPSIQDNAKDENSITEYSLDKYFISDIVVQGSESMSASIEEHNFSDELSLTVDGSGDINLADKESSNFLKKLSCIVRGSGDINLVGISGNEASFKVYGSGDIMGKAVMFKKVEKNIFGSGDILVI